MKRIFQLYSILLTIFMGTFVSGCYLNMDIHSIDYVFEYGFNIVWLASNQCSTLKNVHPYFFINKDKTNFDADISKEELHWHTPDGPAEFTKGKTLADKEILYGGFTVDGVHEGIAISQDVTIAFSFIRMQNDTK